MRSFQLCMVITSVVLCSHTLFWSLWWSRKHREVKPRLVVPGQLLIQLSSEFLNFMVTKKSINKKA